MVLQYTRSLPIDVAFFKIQEDTTMKKIGGMFYYEPCKVAENGYFERVCPPGGDLAFTMSGRCGLYYCLEDIMLQDTRRVAYIPMYTCETVLSSYEKAGYQLKFYDIDEFGKRKNKTVSHR